MFGLQEEILTAYGLTRQRKWKNRDLISSLEFALTGILLLSGRTQCENTVTALVIILAGFFVFRCHRSEWLFLLSIFLVLAFEIINSAIENVVDLASHYHFSMLAKCQIWRLARY